MTVTAGSAPARRRPRSAKSEAGAPRSGAALRAYERRQQRASSVGVTDASARSNARSSLSATAITARIPFVALIICLLSLGLGLTLLLTTRSAGDSYNLSDAKAYNEKLVQERSSLQRDVELADSAPELARKAAEQGMIPAANAARLLVAEDGSVQVIGEPAPASGNPVAPLDPPDSQGTSQSLDSESRNPAQVRNQPTTTPSAPRSASGSGGSVTPVTPATPNTRNDAGIEALGEQLVPMSTPSASPSGSRQ